MTNEVIDLKKVFCFLLFTVMLLSLCSCGLSEGKTGNASVDYGQSEIYSQQDMDLAIDAIKKEFATWKGCELNSIKYKGDEVCKSNIDYCNSLRDDAEFVECIVFESSFRSPLFGGNGCEPNTEYDGWSWYLAREENGQWCLLTWGY